MRTLCILQLLVLKGSKAFSMNARGFEAEKNMDNIFEQNLHWRWREKKNDPDYFTASTKSPSYMWIGSSDAPVPASTIMGEDPAKVSTTINENMINKIHWPRKGTSWKMEQIVTLPSQQGLLSNFLYTNNLFIGFCYQ